jgi:hypothetical protein
MNARYQTFHQLVERFREQLEELASQGSERGGPGTVARAILLLDQGFSLRDTAYATGLCNARVEHFRRRFICLGPPGLSDARPLSTQRSLPPLVTWPMSGAA